MINSDVIKKESNEWLLEMFVDMANKNDFEFGITISISGFLVSGLLIGGKKYFKDFAEEFGKALKDSESLKATIINIGNAAYDKILVDGEVSHPQFIHIREAKFFNTSGNPIPANMGVLWRGRISEITGFHLGLLKSDAL